MIIICPLYMGLVVYHAESTLPVPVPVCVPTYLPTYIPVPTANKFTKNSLSFYSFASIIAHQYQTVCNWEYLQCIYLSFPCFCVLCMICLSFGCPALCFCVLFKCLCSFCETTHVTGSRPPICTQGFEYSLTVQNISSSHSVMYLFVTKLLEH